MPTVQRSSRVIYSAEQMFDLVNDIEKYPEFLHWCRGARVDVRQGNTIEATLDIGVLGFQRSFRTRNTLRRPDRISIELVSGPFRRLRGEWKFVDSGDWRFRSLAFPLVRGHGVAVRRRVLEGIRGARGRPDGRLHRARGEAVCQRQYLSRSSRSSMRRPTNSGSFVCRSRQGSRRSRPRATRGLLDALPEIAAHPLVLGVFGVPVGLRHPLAAGDRVEICRPLRRDPRDRRRYLAS